MFRTHKIRAMTKEDGKAFDDVAEGHEEQGIEFRFVEQKLSAKSSVEAGTDKRKVHIFSSRLRSFKAAAEIL